MDIAAKEPPTPNPTQAEALGQGLEAFLKPIVLECDAKVKDVFASQAELSEQIDKLTEQLDKFIDDSKAPSLAPYVQKLASSRQRVQNINQTLDRITTRLDRIQASVGPNE